jgi:hypothetical protein
VPDRGEEIGRGMERRRSPTAPESVRGVCREAEVRRAISSTWELLRLGKKKEAQER